MLAFRAILLRTSRVTTRESSSQSKVAQGKTCSDLRKVAQGLLVDVRFDGLGFGFGWCGFGACEY